MLEGEANNRNAARTATTEKTQVETALKEQDLQYYGTKMMLSIMDKTASANYKNEQADTLKRLGPEKFKLLETQIKNLNSQISTRAQEMALKERKAGNAQWEYNYEKATTPEEKQRILGNNLPAIQTRMRVAGNTLSALDKQINQTRIEIARMNEDTRLNRPTKVRNGEISGPERDQIIHDLADRLPDLMTRKGAAQINYRHYQKILEETGKLIIPDKPSIGTGMGRGQAGVPQNGNPPAVVAQPKPGAKGLAPVAVPTQNGRPDLSRMSDAEVAAAFAKRAAATIGKGKPASGNDQQARDKAIKERLYKRYLNR